MDYDVKAISEQCRKEYENGLLAKQGRVKDWQGTEDQYYGRVKKVLKSRFNVPVPIMSGFIDTLHSKIDEPPALKFIESSDAGFRMSKKVQSAYERVSKYDDADWESKDLDNKKLACFYGRAIFKTFGESSSGFRFNLLTTDPYDYYIDPMGGGEPEDARYCGEDNIFRSKYDLIEGARTSYYDRQAVHDLVNGLSENTFIDVDNRFKNKANRFSALGLSNQMYNFSGDGMIRLIEAGTTYHGQRFYVLFNYESGIAVRCKPLKQVFKSGLWWWPSWATHRDKAIFWSKAPADDIRPIAEIIKIFLNQELDNRQKKNWGQRAYDPEIFPNAAELEYRPNGLVAVKAGTAKIIEVQRGIYNFQTPDLNGSINLIDYLDNMIGQKSGVTASAQGASDSNAKVGVYYGDLQQVADRLGLYNRSYRKCHKAIGRRSLWALSEHLTQPMAVKILGEKGVIWDQLRSREVNPDMDIMVEGGNAQIQADEVKKKQQFEALLSIKNDPNLAAGMNKRWANEQILRNGSFSDEEIRVALDTENDGSREISGRASEAIEEIIQNKKPKLYRGATTAFQQVIVNFALENTDGDLSLFNRLMAYASAHDELVQENMIRKAMRARAAMQQALPRQIPPGAGNPPQLSNPLGADGPPDNTFAGTAGRGQELSNAMAPAI